MVLVTRQAPDFTAAAVLGNGEIVEKFNFKQHTNGKPTVLFFWPMDFTFVCPSELIAFDKRYEEFQKRGVEVVGVSFDSEFVHNAWRNTPVDRGGIGPVKYAMVADIKREIQKAYGIEHPDEGVALRGSFLIDANGVVRHRWLTTCRWAVTSTKCCAWLTRCSSTKSTAKFARRSGKKEKKVWLPLRKALQNT